MKRAVMFLFMTCMFADSTVTIPLPEATQQQLMALIVPAFANLASQIQGCKIVEAHVLVTYNPIALEIHAVCADNKEAALAKVTK